MIRAATLSSHRYICGARVMHACGSISIAFGNGVPRALCRREWRRKREFWSRVSAKELKLRMNNHERSHLAEADEANNYRGVQIYLHIFRRTRIPFLPSPRLLDHFVPKVALFLSVIRSRYLNDRENKYTSAQYSRTKIVLFISCFLV